MRIKTLVIALILSCVMLLSGLGVYFNVNAAFQSSPTASNIYFWNVFSGGGEQRSSTNYHLNDTVSQSSPLGLSESNAYKLRSGFWPTFAVSSQPSPSNGGSQGGDANYYTELDILGSESRFRVDHNGRVLESLEVKSADYLLIINIPKGTIAIQNGRRLTGLDVKVNDNPPVPPSDSHIIGLAYDFTPEGATFDPPINITFQYDPNNLPLNVSEEDLVIAYYDTDNGRWEECSCTFDPINHYITASISHFTNFALIAHEVLLSPATFTVLNISIQPQEVQVNEEVIVTVPIANTGDVEGTYHLILKVNGIQSEAKEVTVAAGAIEMANFTLSKEQPGTYTVAVDGNEASFTVAALEPAPKSPIITKPPTEPISPETPMPPTPPLPPTPKPSTNWLLIMAISGGVILILLIYLFIRFIQRRYD